jgi:hypothetical protein
MNSIYIHSHHKCASRWAISYFKEIARLNARSFFHSDYSIDVAKIDSDLAFFGNSSYDRASENNLVGLHFVRNPLNLIVSAYFSHLKTHPEDGWENLTTQRALLKAVNRNDGLHLTTLFLDRSDINAGAIGPLFAMRSWNYDDPRFLTVRVEDIVAAPSQTMRKLPAFADLALPQDAGFCFEAISGGRVLGQIDENSHYRSGDANEWKKHIPDALVSYVQAYFPQLLSRFYPDVMLRGQNIDRPFYELNPSVRIALTTQRMSERATVHERWKFLTASEANGWSPRLGRAASLIEKYKSVADLGCGTMNLEKLLSPDTTYIPVDVTSRDHRTIVVDFNRDPLPPSVTADSAALLGIVEYVHDFTALLTQCRERFQSIVMTYNCADATSSILERRAHAWVNDLSQDNIVTLFLASGWTIANRIELGNSQFMWQLV